MVSEKVENVEAFVDKYLYEYRVAGLKLHSIQRMEVTAVGICMAAIFIFSITLLLLYFPLERYFLSYYSLFYIHCQFFQQLAFALSIGQFL